MKQWKVSQFNLGRVSEIQNCFSKSGLYFQSYLALVLYSKVQFFINSSLKLIAWDQFERSLKTYSVASCGFFSLASRFLLFWFYDTQSNVLLLWKRLSLTHIYICKKELGNFDVYNETKNRYVKILHLPPNN